MLYDVTEPKTKRKRLGNWSKVWQKMTGIRGPNFNESPNLIALTNLKVCLRKGTS